MKSLIFLKTEMLVSINLLGQTFTKANCPNFASKTSCIYLPPTFSRAVFFLLFEARIE